MMTTDAGVESRMVTTSLTLNSSPDEVWRALTDPVEIVKWFALSAEVEAGEGGLMVWRWGDVWTWPTRITIWEPGRRLCLSYEQHPESGKKPSDSAQSSQPLIIDFQLESTGSGTLLRLVHSGFGRDASWDDEYDGVRRGWKTELAALKHYLERHAGEARHTAWVFVRTSLPAAAAWNRLIGNVFDASPVIRTRNGLLAAIGRKRAELVIEGYEVASHLIARVPEWGEAQLRLWVDPAAGETVAQVFFSYHGSQSLEVPSAWELRDLLRRSFPDASEVVAM